MAEFREHAFRLPLVEMKCEDLAATCACQKRNVTTYGLSTPACINFVPQPLSCYYRLVFCTLGKVDR
jgi:hypothetical protein